MSTACGIFWDIQNIDIPKKSSADDVVTLIKSNIIDRFDLFRRKFYVVGSYNTIKPETVRRLEDLGATFEEATAGKNVADEMIKREMIQFIELFKRKCTVILITGDSGIGKPLKELKQNSLLKVYFIRLNYSFGEDLMGIADRIFLLQPPSLAEVYNSQQTEYQMASPESFTSPEWQMKYFVKIVCDKYFTPRLLDEIRNDLTLYGGSYAIHSVNDEIWCSFDDVQHARSSFDLKGSYTYQGTRYTIDIDTRPAPTSVINLMECAKMSGWLLVKDSRQTLNMPQHKVKTGIDRRGSSSSSAGAGSTSDFVETINNVSEAFSAMQSMYSTFKSPPGTRPNQSRNTRPNDDGCAQS